MVAPVTTKKQQRAERARRARNRIPTLRENVREIAERIMRRHPEAFRNLAKNEWAMPAEIFQAEANEEGSKKGTDDG